jgi:hypothetical protein
MEEIEERLGKNWGENVSNWERKNRENWREIKKKWGKTCQKQKKNRKKLGKK